MGFRKFSGLDPQVLGVDPRSEVEWARLMEIFNRCRQHSQRPATAAQQGMHLQFYRKALKSVENLDMMAAVVYLNDLFNPEGDASTLKILEEHAQKNPKRILEEPEEILVARLIHYIPNTTMEAFRSYFFRRLIGWSLERVQRQNIKELLGSYDQWAHQYDTLWILYRGKDLASFKKTLPYKVQQLVHDLQPKELREDVSTQVDISDSDFKRYMETVPDDLKEDTDGELAMKIQACQTMEGETQWDQDRCCMILDSCQPSRSSLKEALKETPDWMRRIIRSAST